MKLQEQVDIMLKQLSSFESTIEKIQYMGMFFDPDPEFSQEARDVVRGEICKGV